MNVKEKDIRDEMIKHLEDIERNLAWLSRKTGINYNTLYSIMVHRIISLSEENRALINEAMETDF